MARRGPSIQRLLLGVNVLVLLVPVLAVVLLRIYETHLVRQTEARLIAESVLIGEAWRAALHAAQGVPPGDAPPIQPPHARNDRFFPIEPMVDLNQRLTPPEPPPTRRTRVMDGPAWAAGRAIKPMLDRAKLVNLSGARVLDAEGCVVASTGTQLGDCLDHLPEVNGALAGHYTAVGRPRMSDEPPPPLHSISRRGQVRLFTATPLFEDGRVVGVVRMSRTAIDPLEALWQHRQTLLYALVGSLLLVGAVSLFFARRITRPVRAITEAAEAIARGEARRPLSPGGKVPAEVFQLSRALDTMTAQLRERADYIADFAANVSHELKTPLTSVRGAAELLTECWAEMDDAQRARFLGNIDADAARMQRLVTELLRLARIEHAPPPSEPVDVRATLTELLARQCDAVTLRFEDAPATVHIAPDHLASAVVNLVDNALRHRRAAPVEVVARGAGEKLALTVRDDGPGISEGNRARVFDRFFTTRRDDGGTGLGLALVRAIARGRGGDCTFETGPEGTTFHLLL